MRLQRHGAGPTVSSSSYSDIADHISGPSLEDLFNFCNRKFTLKTVLLLADQLVSSALDSRLY